MSDKSGKTDEPLVSDMLQTVLSEVSLEKVEPGQLKYNLKRMQYLSDHEMQWVQINLCGNPSMRVDFHQVMAVQYTNNKITCSDPIEKDRDDVQAILANTDNSGLMTQFPVPLAVMMLAEASESRYMFFPFNFSCEASKEGHQLTLVIDNHSFKIYLMDPNGTPTYFNSILSLNVNDYLELLIDRWTKVIKEQVGINYTYVYQREWMPHTCAINRHVDVLGGGNCVTSTIILCHILSLTGMEFPTCYHQLAYISAAEWGSLLKKYYIWIVPQLPEADPKTVEMIMEKLEADELQEKFGGDDPPGGSDTGAAEVEDDPFLPLEEVLVTLGMVPSTKEAGPTVTSLFQFLSTSAPTPETAALASQVISSYMQRPKKYPAPVYNSIKGLIDQLVTSLVAPGAGVVVPPTKPTDTTFVPEPAAVTTATSVLTPTPASTHVSADTGGYKDEDLALQMALMLSMGEG